MSVQLLSVETLNGQLSEVLLDAEVDLARYTLTN